jgi:hypothetical protein
VLGRNDPQAEVLGGLYGAGQQAAGEDQAARVSGNQIHGGFMVADRRGFGHLEDVLDEHFDTLRERTEERISLIKQCLELCESPPELNFLSYFIINQEPAPISSQGRFSYLFKPYKLGLHLRCIPQANLRISDGRNYRVDFLFRLCRENPEFIAYSNLVVEIDGHDFHERTKEQAERDKSRDRTLTQGGFYVFRFTGSEVYRNVATVFREVDNYMTIQREKLPGN